MVNPFPVIFVLTVVCLFLAVFLKDAHRRIDKLEQVLTKSGVLGSDTQRGSEKLDA